MIKIDLHDSVLPPINSAVRNCLQSIVLPTVGPPRICTLTGVVVFKQFWVNGGRREVAETTWWKLVRGEQVSDFRCR